MSCSLSHSDPPKTLLTCKDYTLNCSLRFASGTENFVIMLTVPSDEPVKDSILEWILGRLESAMLEIHSVTSTTSITS